MSEGFKNPIIGGGGGLVYPSIHSPNFVQSPLAGWSIDKNGNAFFENLTLGGLGGGVLTGVTIQSSTINASTMNASTINGGTISATDVQVSGTAGGFIIYSTGGTVVLTFTSSGTWKAPAGVTSAKVECWGAGAGAGATDGGGGGGGEYAAEASNTVIPGDTYTITIGAAGTGSTASNNATDGGNTSFSGTGATTVTAHGGSHGADGAVGPQNPGAGGAGGTGSTNTTHHNGGPGGTGTVFFHGGSGGGGSAGNASAGNAGTSPDGGNGNAGAVAVANGGPGGDGGLGADGSAPASGPGGGGGGGGDPGNGAAGFAGQIVITYTSTAPVLLAAFCGSATTDPVTSTACPQGLSFFGSSSGSTTVSPASNGVLDINNKVAITAGGASVIGGTTTDTLEVTGTSDLDGTVTGPDESTWTSSGMSMASGSVITNDTWHNLSLNANFAAAGAPFSTPRYRLEPIGSTAGIVRLSGVVKLTANHGATTTIATLPAGYIPAAKKDLPNNTNLSGTNVFAIAVDTSGNIIMQNAGVTNNLIGLDGLTFELD